MANVSYLALIGVMVDSENDWKLRVDKNTMIIVNCKNGIIVLRTEATPSNILNAMEKFGLNQETDIIRLRPDEFCIPGFVDTHIHASQIANAGLALDLPLLEWLQKYTFPAEAKFSDLVYARNMYDRVVKQTINSGTTTAVYFATIHREASEILCDVSEENGQRALVGKVCMDRNSFLNYTETTKDSLNETRLFIGEILNRKSSLVEPVITPRFVPSCSKELLHGLGDIAIEYPNVAIQSHLAETKQEIAWISSLEPWSKNNLHVFQETGLLSKRSIMAHGIYLDDLELNLLKETETGISHCPNSNCSLRSGRLDVDKLKNFGINIGLGTDCSGGYTTSMLDSMRFSISTSNNVFLDLNHLEEYKPLNYEDVLYLATLGSAKIAGLSAKIGTLDEGKYFDALRIRMNHVDHLETNLVGAESINDIIHKFVFLGDDRNIVTVFVAGKIIKNIA